MSHDEEQDQSSPGAENSCRSRQSIGSGLGLDKCGEASVSQLKRPRGARCKGLALSYPFLRTFGTSAGKPRQEGRAFYCVYCVKRRTCTACSIVRETSDTINKVLGGLIGQDCGLSFQIIQTIVNTRCPFQPSAQSIDVENLVMSYPSRKDSASRFSL